ncbi:FAD-dependent oxidoreductase [Actinophytocola xinjiangensis]|uniref:FAD-dependent oxidoreductase n=1 Tax=Actinophytocola xinjiangensis TaxID=485602 RepID=A0A7Z0WFV2_9PSEU|nr:FAD-dependent monooxygenase [Actinophytocola xinjiangensis]OLF05901.1 FAD-dependent oxidoreductase [Actinophytocola xinjiangensis]
MTKALVIGGGIAGPTTAMALEQVGIDATVYEAYDRGADGVGAFLTLAVNGLAALRPLGLADLLRDTGFDTPSMVAWMGDGRRITEFSFGDPLADGTRNQTITRAALYGAFRDEALRRGITVEYGRRLVDAESTGDGVRARFADGSTAEGDLLIGADGLRSVTRRIIDPQAPAPRYVPLMNVGGYATGLDVDVEPGVFNMVFGRRCFLGYLRAPDGTVWWFANPPQERELSPAELAAISPDQWREHLRHLFAADAAPARALIDATDELFTGWNTYDFPTVPTWHRDRLIIIGDAAHATSPSAGQGASMAIEDAVVLAKCLRDLPDVPAAFRAYESLRRQRVERVVARGKRNGSGKALGPVGRVLLPTFFRLLARFSGGGQNWIFNHRIDWDEPVPSQP